MRNARVAAACFALLASPAILGAGSQVLVGFSEPYGADARVHSGVDVAATADSEVVALRGGEVAFVGRVPSAAGGTMLAVSIDTEEGRLSVMPLASVSVEKGRRIERGAAVGRLAASGDPSCASTHLHVGLRKGGLYIDPSTLLEPAEEVPAGEPPVAAAPQPGGAPRESSPAAGAHTVAPAGVVEQPACVAASPGSAACADVGLQAGATALIAEEGMGSGVSLAPGEDPVVAPLSNVALPTPATGLSAPGSRPAFSLPSVRLAGRTLTLRRGPAVALSLAMLGVSLAGTALLLMRRFVARQALHPTVSTRLGNLLQHLRAGDTLPGLTSCSGPTAFTVPGPSAQRR